MKRMTLLALLLALPSSAVAGGAAATNLNYHVNVTQDVPQDQVIVLRYAQPMLSGQPQVNAVQLCGGVTFPGAQRVESKEPCKRGQTYKTFLTLPSGGPVAFQVFTMRASDLKNSYRVLAQNFEGERPMAPESFTSYPNGATHVLSY